MLQNEILAIQGQIIKAGRQICGGYCWPGILNQGARPSHLGGAEMHGGMHPLKCSNDPDG